MYYRLFFFVVLLSLVPSQANSWDDENTHPIFTREAVNRATDFKSMLKYQLGFKDDDVKLSKGQHIYPIAEWLELGSKKEDDPMCRAASHFHDPWKPWEGEHSQKVGMYFFFMLILFLQDIWSNLWN